MSIAFIFPGQGSQAVGMGDELAKAYPSARAVFDEVDAALSQNLSRVMWEGPESELTLTENAQPALMAVSLAAMRVLTEKGLDLPRSVAFVAGHSLGEYSALAAAGALSLADTARLLKTRGRAMQEAVPVGEGAMAALLGADLAQAQELANAASDGAVCQAANDNAPGQVVIFRAPEACDRAAVGLAPKWARRAGSSGERAPLRLDACCGRDARRSPRSRSGASGSACCQCTGGADHRSRNYSRAPRRAGDRHGAMAGNDALSQGPWREQRV
jgi:[acyl-carrier-protein] S-malonyltransferase